MLVEFRSLKAMNRLFRSFLLLLVFLNPINVTNWQVFNVVEYNLAKCLKKLMENEMIVFTRNVRFSVQSEPSLKLFAGDIIDSIMAMNLQINATFEMAQTSGEKSLFEVHTRIIFIDSFNSFKLLLNQQRSNGYYIHGIFQYYYIVLMKYRRGANFLGNILDFCLKNYIVNVNVLVEEDTPKTVTIYTYYPFTESSCRSSTPTIHNRFISGMFQWNRPVFPGKINNLWRCPIKVVLWHKPPFVFLQDNLVSGIDVNFMIFLSQAMNFTLMVYKSTHGLGEILSNGTMTGAFGIIKDGEGDLMIGGTVCSKLRRQNLACTMDYFTTSLQIVVKKPYAYSSFEILLFPFDPQTWSTLLAFLFGNFIVQNLRKKIANKLTVKQQFSTRLQILTWLLSILVIRSCYEGSIFKFLHNRPIRRIPHDFEEALADGYKFIAKSTYFPFIKHIPELADKLVLSQANLGKLFDELDRFEGNYGIINLDNYLSVIANDSTRYGRYVQIQKPILYSFVCVYLPKFSFLTKELNRQIEIMTNYGHMQKIYDLSVTDKLGKIKTDYSSNYAHTMQLHEIIGAFQLLVGLMAVSGCLFLVEVAAKRNIFIQRVMDIFH